MNPILRKRLLAVSGAGAIAIAGVLGKWYEGTGPTQRQASGEVIYSPYRDPVGIWTVCHGITGSAVIPSKRYTEAECTALERIHYVSAERAARRMFPAYASYNEWVQAALLDWLYNLGEGSATANSTLRAKFNSGDVDGGCRELVKWVNGRVKGKLTRLPGLVDRRDATQEICLKWGRV